MSAARELLARGVRLRRGCAAAVLLLACSAWAAGQVQSDLKAEDRTLLERLSLAKARTALAEQIARIELQKDQTIGTWAAQVMPRDRALRQWIRTLPRFGEPRLYSDGMCESDVRLEPATLRDQLLELQKNHPAPSGDKPTAEDLRRLARDWPAIHVTGVANVPERTGTARPPGWEDVAFEGVQVTRRAAEADALATLFESLRALKMTNVRRLDEFLGASPEIGDAVRAALEKSATVQVEFGPDQVATADARISMTELLRILTDVHQRLYRGAELQAADFREMALLAETNELRAAGLATPPARYLVRSPYELIELDAPPWISTLLSATGRYEPRDEDRFDEATALAAARLAAIDALRAKVEALVVQKEVTVGEFLRLRPGLKDDVVTWLSGAKIVGAPGKTADGGVEVRVELSARRLWDIVKRGMRTVELDPEDVPAATTQPASRPAATAPSQPIER